MPTKGTFITLEGIEGCGKTTQMTLVRDLLLSEGMEVVTTMEPGEGPIGRGIRDQLLSHHDEPLDPVAELMLYLADRAQHVTRLLGPALEGGKIVLCDRYADSTLAYQGYGRGLPLEMIDSMNDLATRGLLPDLTFLLDCPPEIGLNRIVGGLDRMESQGLSFHQRVRDGYLALSKKAPERFVVIDATQPADVVFDQILLNLKERGILR